MRCTTLNTIAQEGEGNKELEGMVSDLKKAFNVDIKRGKGDLTQAVGRRAGRRRIVSQ